MIDPEDDPRYQLCRVCGAKDCDCTANDLKNFLMGAASRDAEVAELKQTCIDHVEIQNALRKDVTLLRDTLQRIANRFNLGNGKCCGAAEQHTYNEATEALDATEQPK